jgi:transposase
MLKYKAELNGINFQTTEEAYTSKCDSLTMETLEHHENYSGKRVHRGLFVSSAGFAMNADVNGAVNIVRKVVGNSYASRIINSGLLFNPVKSPEVFTNKSKVFRNFNRIKHYE